MPARLRLNPVACAGHGACAELLPELIELDEWGFPLLPAGPVPEPLRRQARRAAAACPALALMLETTPEQVSEETHRNLRAGTTGTHSRLGA
jgi:ferredoxin